MDEDLLVCYTDNNVDFWVMDSSASFHATHNSEALQNLVIGDNRNLDVTGMADIVLKTLVDF